MRIYINSEWFINMLLQALAVIMARKVMGRTASTRS